MLKVVHDSVNPKRITCFCIVCVAILAVFISLGLIFNSNINSVHATNPQSVDYNVYVKPSLNISVSSNTVALNINPAGSLNGANNPNNFASNNLNVSVATNNQYGYKLYLATENNTTDLVRNQDPENTGTDDGISGTIPTLTTTTSEADFPYNKWGYKQDSETNYKPFQSNTLISSSTIATNEQTSQLTFGAKANYDKPAGQYELDLNFKAVPEVTTNYIQNLDPDLCTEDPTVVIDSRDEQPYTVQRLKDGNCWMMTNLNLNYISSDLTANDTNIATGTTISATDFNNNWRKDSGSNVYNSPELIAVPGIDATSNTPYGTLYNFCATSAGTYCYGANEGVGNSGQDLCPAGWRLPTGGSNSEFANLYALYDSDYNKMRGSILSGGLAFALSGWFTSSTPVNQDSRVRYHSSTVYDTLRMYDLAIDSPDTINTANASARGSGSPIRCIRTKSMQDFSSNDAASMSIGDRTTLRDTRDGQYYIVSKLADGNVWMTDDLLFQGATLNPDTSDVSTTRTMYNGGNWSSSYSLKDNASATTSNCYGDVTGSGSGYNKTCMYYVASDSNVGGKPTAWYNYSAATAGSIIGSQNSNIATESICPKGWSLPSHAQTINLASLIGSSPASFNPNYSGYYVNGTLSLAGTFGGWWDTGVYSDYSRFNLQYSSGAISSTNYTRRSGGHAIRCVAK